MFLVCRPWYKQTTVYDKIFNPVLITIKYRIYYFPEVTCQNLIYRSKI